MPSIPTYGFAELEPSMLNTAKRRIVGLMDTSQEALTEEPEKDPTGGKQDTFLEQLTEEIYTTIKDIEVLDTFINENSGVDELRLTTAGQPDTLRALRPEFKKGASQIALVNNALRKINATYERLRTNIEYTNLKIFTYFINSVRILKKTALDFFAIIDDLIDNIRKAQGVTSYIRPVINDNDEELETEEPPSTAIVPPFLSTPTPVFPPVPTPLPPPPPPPPPPTKPPSKAKILAFKVKVSSKAKTAGLDATQTADVLSLADAFVATNGRVGDATEIDTLIADYLASSAPPAPAPSPAPPTPAPAPSPAPPTPAPAPSPAPPTPAPAPSPAPPLPPIAVMGISPDVIDFQNRASDILAKTSLINANGIKKLRGALDALQNKINAGADYSRELNTLKEKVFYHETPFIKVDRKKIPKNRLAEHESVYSKYENEKKKGNSKIQKFVSDLVDFYDSIGFKADVDYRIEPSPTK